MAVHILQATNLAWLPTDERPPGLPASVKCSEDSFVVGLYTCRPSSRGERIDLGLPDREGASYDAPAKHAKAHLY